MQEQKDAQDGRNAQQHEAVAGFLASGVFTEELGMVFARKLKSADLLFDFAGDTAKIAAFRVAGDIDSA